MLNARLAAAESMTHDVIRDLLGVKLDMSSYAVSLWCNDLFRDMFSLLECLADEYMGFTYFFILLQ